MEEDGAVGNGEAGGDHAVGLDVVLEYVDRHGLEGTEEDEER